MNLNRRANDGAGQFIHFFPQFNQCFHGINRQDAKDAKPDY